MSILEVALVGAGRIGRVHARSIAGDRRSRLAAVADAVPDAAASLAAEHGAAVRNVDDALADPAIAAVVIASPTDTHAALIERAAAAGKAVFCEKPIDLDLARARKVADAVRHHPRPVMVGFNRRFDPDFAALRQALDEGRAGRPETLAVTSFDPAPPPPGYVEASGGLFADMTIHDFDMCCFLLGMPDTVSAHGACLVDPAIGRAGDIDTAVVVLGYGDGRLATIRNSRRAAYGYDQRVEVLGSGGLLAVGNRHENGVTLADANGVRGAKPVHFFLERYAEAYRVEWSAFVAAALDGAAVPATLEDGVNALALAAAANLSLAEGRTVRVAEV